MKKKIAITACVAFLIAVMGSGNVFAAQISGNDELSSVPTVSEPVTSEEAATEPASSQPTSSEGTTTEPASSEEENEPISSEIESEPESSSDISDDLTSDPELPEEEIEEFLEEQPIAEGLITLDGYFDDWDDKPKTELFYDSASTDRKTYIGVIADEMNIYCYATIARNFDGTNFVLTIDGKTVRFEVYFKQGNKPSKPGSYEVILRDSSWNIIGSGMVVLGSANENHQMEFALPFDALKIKPETVKKITLKNPSYGRGEATTVGTPTGPIISLCAIGACIGFGNYKAKKNKRKNKSC